MARMVALEKQELLALLKTARESSERDFLMILTAYSHALRASEVCSLTTDSVRDGFLTVQRLKGSLRTTQELVENSELLLNERAALSSWIAGKAKGERLFDIGRKQFFNVFRKHAEAAGIPAHKRHPHVLKHARAQAIIGKGIEVCRQYCGHRSIASTGEYLKISDEQACAAVAGC